MGESQQLPSVGGRVDLGGGSKGRWGNAPLQAPQGVLSFLLPGRPAEAPLRLCSGCDRLFGLLPPLSGLFAFFLHPLSYQLASGLCASCTQHSVGMQATAVTPGFALARASDG